MRALELIQLSESRGITARQPGEVYVNPTDQTDILTIVEIKMVKPIDGVAFETHEELLIALDQVIPDGGTQVNDNIPNSASKAAIVAEVETGDGKRQYHVRYLRDLKTIHGKWLTFNGYKYRKALETESLPIKPSDLIPDENPRTASEVIATIKNNIDRALDGTQFEHMGEIIESVIDAAATTNTPIQFEKRSQAGIVAKYAGEYAGVIALLNDNIEGISLSEIEDYYDVHDMKNSTIIFPQDTAAMLIDSYITTPKGKRLGVSSKMYSSGGAASSLLGIYKIMTPDLAKQYPKGATIIKDLAVLPAYSANPKNAGSLGPVVLARQIGFINTNDIEEIEQLTLDDQDLSILKSDNLRKLISNQQISSDTTRPEYSIYNHFLTAIVNKIVTYVNKEPQFTALINAVLRESSYIQVLTKTNVSGNNVTFSYYVKMPENNTPYIFNKTYYATGNKGRIGFKMEK